MTEEAEVCTKISEKVKMAGFLEKKGSMLWKRYWFVLEDKLLLYYKSQLEYINLSPCRGSVNMGLVSTVQPRRNSRDPIIHLVSRSQNLVLKAKDRFTQEKWLQALLDSIGKQGMASLRFSLDDLPGETQARTQTMTLPRRLHGGSLDAVWKPAVIPKTKMLDKVLGYEDEPDENQNTDLYDPLTKERKSQTLDTRRMDTRLKKLRNAIGRRKSSTALVADPEKVVKTRRESFIQKIFKKPSSRVEKEVEIVDSDLDDPLYDTIDHAKTSTEPLKPKRFGSKILLPEGTMAELKEKLRSKESLEKEVTEGIEPPALPPRGSLTALDGTTEVVIHPCPDEVNPEDSEDSEVSGHYQTIKKPVIEVAQPPKEMVTVEAEYQVVNKDKKKKRPKEILEENLEKVLEIPGKEIKGIQGLTPMGDLNIPQEIVVNLITELKITEEENEVESRNQENAQGEPSGDYHSSETPKQLEENFAAQTISGDKTKEVLKQDMEKGLCELNSLLRRLTEITSAPLAEREGLASWSPEMELPPAVPRMVRSHSDPDYDIPRPHAPLALAEDFDEDRIQATEFFNRASSTGSTNSLEPDSLEAKRESLDINPE